MEAPFPFGLPASTALYYSLYLVTLALHAIFLAYVLAGSAYLAVAMIRRTLDPIAEMIKEWLPFALGATITAGVGPLLFLQILYKTELYSSSLLLSHRWMAILPVLIAGFYLLYLLKSELAARLSPGLRAAIATAAFGCFAFVGYAWTENHLLASARETWAAMYGDGRMFYVDAEVPVRFSVWAFGSVPVSCMLVGWQLRLDVSDRDVVFVRLAKLALAGTIAALAAAIGYSAMLEPAARANLVSTPTIPHLVYGAIGLALLLGANLRTLQTRTLSRAAAIASTAGVVFVIFATTAIREAIRTSRIELDALVHAQIGAASGFPLFMFFFVINAALIAACIVWVRRARV
jgi:hypothetical protein